MIPNRYNTPHGRTKPPWPIFGLIVLALLAFVLAVYVPHCNGPRAGVVNILSTNEPTKLDTNTPPKAEQAEPK